MKTFTSILTLAALLVVSTNAFATVFRVNNTPGVNANFTSMSTALSSASVLTDDTLYVEGSTISYGVVNVTKRLVIIGSGYFITENPQTQAILPPSRFDRLTFTSPAAGSVIIGITVDCVSCQSTGTGAVEASVNNLVFSRCNFINSAPTSTVSSGSTLRITANNIIVSSCFISQTAVFTSGSFIGNQAIRIDGGTGIVVANNIIKLGVKGTNYDSVGQQYAFWMTTGSSTATIVNNVFMGRLAVLNASVQNNILISGSYVTNGSFPSSSFSNIGNTTQFGTANGNQQNVTMANVFTYGPGSENVDNHYQLKAGSPAIGAGLGGVDCGAYGGTGAYYLSGMPGIPSIFDAIVPAIGNTGSNLGINVKAKAHN